MPSPPPRRTPHQLPQPRPPPRRFQASAISSIARHHADVIFQNLSHLGYDLPTHDTLQFAAIFSFVVMHAQLFCRYFNADHPGLSDDEKKILYLEIKLALMEKFFNAYIFWVEYDRYECFGGPHGPPAV